MSVELYEEPKTEPIHSGTNDQYCEEQIALSRAESNVRSRTSNLEKLIESRNKPLHTKISKVELKQTKSILKISQGYQNNRKRSISQIFDSEKQVRFGGMTFVRIYEKQSTSNFYDQEIALRSKKKSEY